MIIKAAMLITKFGSVRALLGVPEDELASVPGIGPALAKRLISKLKEIDGTGEQENIQEERNDDSGTKQD